MAESSRCLGDAALAAGSSHAAPVKNHQARSTSDKRRKAAWAPGGEPHGAYRPHTLISSGASVMRLRSDLLPRTSGARAHGADFTHNLGLGALELCETSAAQLSAALQSRGARGQANLNKAALLQNFCFGGHRLDALSTASKGSANAVSVRNYEDIHASVDRVLQHARRNARQHSHNQHCSLSPLPTSQLFHFNCCPR